MVQHLLMYIYFCQWTFWMGQNMDSFIYLLMMYKGPVNKNCYFPADQTMFCFLYKGPVNKNCYFPADQTMFCFLFSFQAVVAMFFVLFLCSTCICLVSVLPKYFWTCRLLGFHSTSLAADDLCIYIQPIHIILISFSVVGFSLQSLPCLFLHDKANSKSFKFTEWKQTNVSILNRSASAKFIYVSFNNPIQKVLKYLLCCMYTCIYWKI